jgi:hypothetical protein
VVLTVNSSNIKSTKKQVIFKQLSRTYKNSVIAV